MFKSLQITKLIPVVILAAWLAGCSTAPEQKTQKLESISLQEATYTPEFYLAKIKVGQTLELQQTYTLLACQAYLNQSNYTSAEKLLLTLSGKLVSRPELQAKYLYLKALSLKQQTHYKDALEKLQYPQNWRLPKWQWIAYYQLKAKLYQHLQQPIQQVAQLSLLESFLTHEQQIQVNENIWQALQPLTDEQVRPYIDSKTNPIFTGWMQLAYIAKFFAVSPNELVKYLGQWQEANPQHPGAIKLPASLEKALNVSPYQPKNIAVLLPLTGTRASVADPIKQGILSSYLAKSQPQITLKFYDTSEDVTQAYNDAISAGAEFIIGPLLQANVDKLEAYITQQTNLKPIPQLFLNQAKVFLPRDDQFYFSLSPSQEAADAAKRLYQDGIRVPLLLVSDDTTGHRMAEAFTQKWHELSHSEAEVHYFQDGSRMDLAVKRALGVTDSKVRIAKMKAIAGRKLKADFRSRQDIDAIYMITSSRDLTLLKPFIDVNFSVFSRPVPLYTSSRARLERDINQTAIELNNITISDIPWLMKTNEQLQQVKKLWPNWNNSQKRLYSMGYDAVSLINLLSQMRAFPGFQYQARSGALSVDHNGVIERHLSWGRYQKGKLKLL